MSNEFGGRGRGTKRKVEQNSSTSSKKPRGELQTPALPGDAWVLMLNNMIRFYGIFHIFATQLLCILPYMHAFLKPFIIRFFATSDLKTLCYTITTTYTYSENLILFEKILLLICILTYTNVKSHTYTYYHLLKWRKSPNFLFAATRL